MTVNDLKIGMCGIIEDIKGEKVLRHHFLDMGLVPGTNVRLIKKAPMGDPIEIRIRGYELTLRGDDAKHIYLKTGQENMVCDAEIELGRLCSTKHPRVGEEEYYETKRKGRQIPDNEILTFALIGNQNSGKTTLFNQITGSKQHVGNFPGVTVDRKDGIIRGYPKTRVTDLPGIYSLHPYSNEEIVTRNFLIQNRPHGIINILDATNIERNLYLTLQLAELNIPMVIALNMMDEVRENGVTICVNALEAALGIPVVPISAIKNEGIDELVEHAISMARHRERPGRKDFCNKNGGPSEQAVHRSIHALIHLVDDHAREHKLPRHFVATRLAEEDEIIKEMLHLDKNEEETLEHILLQMEEESGMDRVAAVVNSRFCFIDQLCAKTVRRPKESKEHRRSLKMDRILTGRFTGIPAFLGIMAIVFWLTFGVFGPLLGDVMNVGIEWLIRVVDQALTTYEMNEVVHSLVIDGIFAGVGSVLSFLPIILVLFFFLSLLEDSGYMARIAFVMDKPLRKIGLSGRSFVPMLVGFGCSVPAIMATRTLSSERDRKMTILLTPFMSCSAKLPIYALFTAAFFPSHQVLVIMALYLMGILAAIGFALLVRVSKFKGQPIPFVMELPNYRFPSLKSVFQLIWDKAKDFLTKAFTIIFFASIIVWFLQTFDIRMNVVADSSNSILALLGGWIAPIFVPLGFGDWRASTALITGLVAKESVVSTLTVLLQGSTGALKTMFTPLTAFVFLVFTLYYTPCVAAIAAVKREMNSVKSAVIVVILQCGIAWILAYMVSLIGKFILMF
jgi:ferrous iron transport protein B